MKVALVYPPPWKIVAPHESVDYGIEGHPDGYLRGDLDGDFHQTPYGLLTLAAQAIRAGHQVKLLNLSAYPWSDVERIVAALDAEVFGMSCWTANRRGVGYTARLIKAAHPQSHVLVGGPHASPLAKEMLAHHPDIDTVTTGESDATFLELLERRTEGVDNRGLAGAWYRYDGGVEQGPPRGNMKHLDALECVQTHFRSHIFMTSRGCPWACTFCGAESQWGRGFRAHSVSYVLDALEQLVEALPVKMVLVKDDTFTTQKKRVIELCRGIRDRGLNFNWSCDTRVDLLSDDLLREMRLAGCERLSLGVESGAPEILKNVDKKITVDDILRSTELAKKYGIKVRYYMMLGNRGETTKTFEQTLRFLEEAQPHEFIFSCLSIYPGTQDFARAEREGWVSRDLYFEEPFQELKIPFDADEACTEMMNDWFADNCGLQRNHRPNVAEAEGVLSRLEGHGPAHLDLCEALYLAGDHAGAAEQAKAALKANHPLPGLALNYLGCCAVERGDYDAMMRHFTAASEQDPQHYVLLKNVEKAREWFRLQGPARGLALELDAHHDFQLLEKTQQPTLPGPLADDFATWSPAIDNPEADPAVARLGSNKRFDAKKRLEVL